MAGKGQRFIDAGYSIPKPLISINGKPMVENVIRNLAIEGNYIFICRDQHYEKFFLEKNFKKNNTKLYNYKYGRNTRFCRNCFTCKTISRY